MWAIQRELLSCAIGRNCRKHWGCFVWKYRLVHLVNFQKNFNKYFGIAQDLQHLCKVIKVRRENAIFTIYIQIEDEAKLKDFQTGMIILISNGKFCTTFHKIKSESYCTGIITSSDPLKCQVTVVVSQEHGEESLISHFSNLLSENAYFCVWAVLSEKFTSGFYCYMALHAFEEIHEVWFVILILRSFKSINILI